MTGETDIARLLAGMTPVLDPATYVFASVTGEVPAGTRPIMSFAEDEGTTLILREDAAASLGIAATFPCRRITLMIHSALEAVGFMAAITSALARAGVGVNPVAGYYHDHLFVPRERADEVMGILRNLSRAGVPS
jgi:hypothetical protein